MRFVCTQYNPYIEVCIIIVKKTRIIWLKFKVKNIGKKLFVAQSNTLDTLCLYTSDRKTQTRYVLNMVTIQNIEQ